MRNSADALVYQTERFMSENAEKIPDDAKANVEGPLDELKKALEGTDNEAIKSAAEKVATASQALGAAMYQSGDVPGAAGDGGESADSDDDIVDAEVVDEGSDTDESTTA